MADSIIGVVVTEPDPLDDLCLVWVEKDTERPELNGAVYTLHREMKSKHAKGVINLGQLLSFPRPAPGAKVPSSQCARLGQWGEVKVDGENAAFGGTLVLSPDGALWCPTFRFPLVAGQKLELQTIRPNIAYNCFVVPTFDRATRKMNFVASHIAGISYEQQEEVARAPWNEDDPSWTPPLQSVHQNYTHEDAFVFAPSHGYLLCDDAVEFEQVPVLNEPPWTAGQWIRRVKLTWLHSGYVCTKWRPNPRDVTLISHEISSNNFAFLVPVNVVEHGILYSEHLFEIAATAIQLQVLKQETNAMIWVVKNEERETVPGMDVPRWRFYSFEAEAPWVNRRSDFSGSDGTDLCIKSAPPVSASGDHGEETTVGDITAAKDALWQITQEPMYLISWMRHGCVAQRLLIRMWQSPNLRKALYALPNATIYYQLCTYVGDIPDARKNNTKEADRVGSER